MAASSFLPADLGREDNVEVGHPRTAALQFTCRNCGGGDRGRVAIYRPFGELRRAKIVLSPVWCSRPTTGVPLAPATMNFVGLDLTTTDRYSKLEASSKWKVVENQSRVSRRVIAK
ncbi:hypothetical protein TNCV_3797981 [Trichonephila clavipes]|nr:hypothetical protein TNCV_3797981 [Trichonephila clavipes]